ncbi:MAG: peptidylprolyl isomerase, partial [Candidatus Magasanikbacteria bacterium]|nr:peptidylprolyl isomerase [Candidatus Magasanikbacteria bacterium]
VKSEAEDTKVKTQAAKILAEIKAGASFADMAKKYGTDSTKDTGGDLGWFGRGAMVAEFEAAAFALEKGALAPAPIKTEFGYHLIKVEDKRNARNFSLFMNDRLKNSEIEIFGKVHNPFANLNTSTSGVEVETK